MITRSKVNSALGLAFLAALLAMGSTRLAPVQAAAVVTTQTLAPEADTRVERSQPTKRFGGATTLTSDGSPVVETYVRFNVTSGGGRVTSAVLRMFVSDGTLDAPAVYPAGSTWSEAEMTWNNRAARTGPVIVDTGAVSAGAWVQYDVSSYVAGPGTYSMALASTSGDNMNVNSRENSSTTRRPQLVLTIEAEPLPDTAPPDTTITSAPAGTVPDRSANIAFTSSEPGSSFECSLNAAAFTACLSPQRYTELADSAYTFAVRARDAAGNLDGSAATTTWTVAATGSPGTLPGSLPGIEPEAQSHVPPYVDGNGNLYRIVEEFASPEPNHNTPRMMKSHDGGRTWAEVDEAGRPTDNDLEGSWLLQAGTSLIYVYSDGGMVSYSAFNTSDALASPDRWVTKNERGITGLTAGSQQWACAARTSDGRVWVFFSDSLVGSNKQLAYIRRDSAGTWTTKTRISTDTDSFAGATCVVDPATDVTHVFLHDYVNKRVLHRSLTGAGVLSAATRIDTTGSSAATRNYNAVTNPVVSTAGGSTVVTAMFASASGLRAVSITDGVVGVEQVVDAATPLISPANSDRNTGNDGPVMHLATHGSTVHAVWAKASTGDVWHSSRPHSGGTWTTPRLLVDSGTGHVSWLYANVLTRGGTDLLAYTYDLGPHLDNAGVIRYDHLPPPVP